MWVLRIFLACVASVFVATAASAITVHPERVQIDWIYGADRDAVYNTADNGTYDIIDGQEVNFFGLIGIDVGTSSISVTVPRNIRFNQSRTFNGFRITDVDDSLASILSLNPVGAAVGLVGVEYEEDAFYFNFVDVPRSSSEQTYEFEVTLASVPLPSSAAFMLVTLGGLGFMLRRRARRT